VKTLIFIPAVLLIVPKASAQQPAPVKMECRDISTSGNVIFANETLVNGMACHVVDVKQPPSQPSATPTTPITDPTPAQAVQASATVPAATPSTGSAAAVMPAAPISKRIESGAPVFLAPMQGFETYMAAALQKKNVPLVQVANEEQATYILKGTAEEKKAGWAKIAFTGNIHSDDAASVQLIDRRTGAIVFAYAVDKKNTLHGEQTTAEACAKHLKEAIEKK